ncbi:DEAD/DEAH box helicase [Flavobacterium sediminilitoris]|uniref:DEAD/DEAH box helicase n=1 Tax=Flavobacterium sediminilitoris TaxID=2024526 RepID=A0ABY4HNA0_9FLAO|nr:MULTISPECIES: DEAD/DEAH box helicase [Flavobacterium]UOX34055.1 DEAD/DEAH box helicase [Flavobacterium sediminilitoris]
MEETINYIESTDKINFESTFNIYKYCSALIVEDEQKAQKLLVNILGNKSKFEPHLDFVLADLIEGVGFYPYIKKEDFKITSTDALIRNAYHQSDNLDKVLHEDQKYLLSLINSDKNVIVSAPTSFGKSLLIEEIVATSKFENIIVIQPTLALLDETRRKLMKYDDRYKLIVRTSQEPSIEKGNLFLLTAERVNEFKNLPRIDLIIIDEFYKLSTKRDDERADSLNNAFNYVLKTFNPKFYLLGPNIDSISEGFTEKYNAIFYKTKSSLVDTKSIDIYSEHKDYFDKPIKFKEYKENILFDLLISLQNEQSIIYCSSPARVRYLSSQFLKYLIEKNYPKTNDNLDIIEWIKINISAEWSLLDLLSLEIGIHDGALQKHITTTIIDYFNTQKIKYLFCTSTIIEGVNTSAKNIIYFDSTKGRRTPIDFFDYSNIKGRAGRLMVHYIGKIYNFNEIPENNQVVIDIPFFEQNPISDEVLINLEDVEVKDSNKEQLNRINELPPNERDLIKQNGVQVFGQKNIIDTIRTELKSKYHLISWSNYPTKQQLEYILGLAWNNLLKPNETVRPMTLNKLVTVTQIYGYNQNIWNLVNSTFSYFKGLKEFESVSDNEIMDEAIRDSFQVLKHWLEYKVPKWLSVINSIQEFVCNESGLKPGNYTYFSNLIENDFIRENLVILSEYGIPTSAIRKLENIISAKTPQEEVMKIIKSERLFDNKIFIEYERNKLKNN